MAADGELDGQGDRQGQRAERDRQYGAEHAGPASGDIVRRRELVRAGWPEGAHVSDNTLDQYLTQLRRKLRESGSELTVTTARGIGHRLS